MPEIMFQKFPAGSISASSQKFSFDVPSATPRVSCLMVTRGRMQFVKHAYRQYKLQSWPNKELVIVSDNITQPLDDLASSDPGIILVRAAKSSSLGELRNLSIARSTGDFVCQWDDDDLYDPQRISISMGILMKASASAVFLNRVLLWWQQRNLLSISQLRVWEGSIVAARSVVPVYPSLPKREDTEVVNWITQHHSVALFDHPNLYCYRVTGQNTWNEKHFENMFRDASYRFPAEQMRDAFTLPCFAEPENA
jgi:glycosyltransferase involved in cell wall biosynthesis